MEDQPIMGSGIRLIDPKAGLFSLSMIIIGFLFLWSINTVMASLN